MWDQIVVFVLLAISLLLVTRHLFPRLAVATQQRSSHVLAQLGCVRLSRWVAPTAASGCDAGCHQCESRCQVAPTIITPSVAAEDEPQVVQWRDAMKK